MRDCPAPCKSLLINVGAKNLKLRGNETSDGIAYFYFTPRITLSKVSVVKLLKKSS